MEKQITWTVAAISEFAKAKALSAKQAFNYLNLFKGLDFLQNHYGAEHMLSFEDTVDDLTAICQRNGGANTVIRSEEAERMTAKQEFLVEGIVSDMTKWLMEERSVSLQEALGLIYNSQTFEKIQDSATGLYSESSAYNYDLLVSELTNGKIVQADF